MRGIVAGGQLLVVIATVACTNSEPEASSRASHGPLGFIVVEWPDRLHRVQPNETVALRARVIDEQSAPVRGARVHFLAPELGPSATFAATGSLSAEVTSDDDGRVSAELVAGASPGAFFVSAYQVDGPGRAAYSVTVGGPGAEPSLSSDDALAYAQALAVRDVVDGSIQGADPPEVLGPLFLLEGMALHDWTQPGAPIETARGPAWLTWVTPSGFARVGAPSVLTVAGGASPAGSCDAEVLTHETGGMLEATFDGVTYPLSPPVRTNSVLPGLEPPAEPALPADSAGQALEAKGACAVFLIGEPDFWDVPALARDIAHARTFFRDVKRVAHVIEKRASWKGTTLEEFQANLADAATKCESVYVYMNGHSTRDHGFANLWLLGPGERSFQASHATLAKVMKNTLAGKVFDITIIIDSCNAERAVSQYQGLGMSGHFLLSSHDGQPANTSPTGSVFSNVLFEEWSARKAFSAPSLMAHMLETLENGIYFRGVEWSRWVLKNEQTMSTVPLRPDFTDWNLGADAKRAPDVALPDVGKPVSVVIQRPIDAMMSRPGVGMRPMPFRIWFDDPKIATIVASPEPDGGFKLSFDRSAAERSFQMIGLAPGTTRYRVEGRAWHHAFRGHGTVVVGGPNQCKPAEPCPEPVPACDARLPITLVAETAITPDTVEQIGIPTVNDAGDVLTWGMDEGGHSYFPAAHAGDLEGADPTRRSGWVLGAHHRVPVVIQGAVTTLITRRGHPRTLGDDGSFGFPADLLVGPSVSQQAALANDRGTLTVLGTTTSNDPLKRLADQVRSNGKGVFAWAIGDVTQSDVGAHHEIHRRKLGASCSERVIAIEEPLPDAPQRTVTAARLWGVGPSGELMLIVRHRAAGTPVDDVATQTTAAMVATPEGPLLTLLGGGQSLPGGLTVDELTFWAKSDPTSGTMLVGADCTDSSGQFQGSLAVVGTSGGVRVPPQGPSPPTGVDPSDANEMAVSRYFVGPDRVAFSARLSQTDSSLPNYGPVGSALFLEPKGGGQVVLAIREGNPAPCRPGMVWGDTTLEGTRVYFAGDERVYVRAAVRPASGVGDGYYGLWLVDGPSIVPIFLQQETVTLVGHPPRVVKNFAQNSFDTANGLPEFPDTARTNRNGQIVIDVVHEDAGQSFQAVWLIGP
jgi:hypothetical protein